MQGGYRHDQQGLVYRSLMEKGFLDGQSEKESAADDLTLDMSR